MINVVITSLRNDLEGPGVNRQKRGDMKPFNVYHLCKDVHPSYHLIKIAKGHYPHYKFGILVILCKYYKITDVATKRKFKVRNGITTTKKKNYLTKKRKNQAKITAAFF
jgi:hypothetical protein